VRNFSSIFDHAVAFEVLDFRKGATYQIKSNQSNQIYLWHKKTNTNERSKTKSNVPTGHKGSKQLH